MNTPLLLWVLMFSRRRTMNPIHLLVIGRPYSLPKRWMNAAVTSPIASLDCCLSKSLITSRSCASTSMPRSATISRWRSRATSLELSSDGRIADDADEWREDLIEPGLERRVHESVGRKRLSIVSESVQQELVAEMESLLFVRCRQVDRDIPPQAATARFLGDEAAFEGAVIIEVPSGDNLRAVNLKGTRAELAGAGHLRSQDRRAR